MTPPAVDRGRLEEPGLWEGRLLLLAVLGALVIRFCLLAGPLDEPSWRQVWSAYPARIMARESPPQVLHPKINFRGADWVATDNFPTYEFLAAMVYKLAGGEERLPLARAVTLGFFIGALGYFHGAVRRLGGARVAWYSTVAFASFPVGIFYSRAVHYDMHVIFLNLGFFYHALRYNEERRGRDLALAVFMSVLGTVIKPPYGLYLFLPVAVCVIMDRGWDWRTLALWIGVGALSVACGLLFDRYRATVAAGRLYHSLTLHPLPYSTGMAVNHFFGDLLLRVDFDSWKRFLQKALSLLMNPLLVGAALLGLPAALAQLPRKPRFVLAAVLAGGVGYVLLIFPMLRIQGHDWYLLPLLAPAAVLAGLLGATVARWAPGGGRLAVLVALLWSGLLYGASARTMRNERYLQVDRQLIAAGEAIRGQTGADDLVVCLLRGRTTGPTDPRLLYFADRRGWNRALDDCTREQLDEFIAAGAHWLAVFATPDFKLESVDYPQLAGYHPRILDLARPGEPSRGKVLLYQLPRPDGEK